MTFMVMHLHCHVKASALLPAVSSRKELAEQRRDGLKASLDKHKRMNRALRRDALQADVVEELGGEYLPNLGRN